ncbi:unnamed protein product, partial [Brugia timori]|uniref:Glutamate decarboxylase n=1 Tax=Brugia timori TaxID=42155 RepID=A0A0R3R7H0_9BILA
MLQLLPQNKRNWDSAKKFLEEIVKILLEYINEENQRENKILDFYHPAEMQKLIDLSIPDNPRTLHQLLQDCREVLRLGVRTGHPRFFNQISCGLDLVSMAGEWLTATANTNMYDFSALFIENKIKMMISYYFGILKMISKK